MPSLSSFYCASLDCSSASKKLEHQRDNREDDQDVNEEAGNMEHEESTGPKQKQNNRKDDKHRESLSGAD